MSLAPLLTAIGRRLGHDAADLRAEALERWVIAPAEDMQVRKAIFLPHQLDRIRQSAFVAVADVRRAFEGDFSSPQTPTYGYRFRHVDLVDGVLYGHKGIMHLRRRQHWPLWKMRPREAISGALYESWIGNRWFGTWLHDDCLTYPLAVQYGQPVTSAPELATGHVRQYESRLGMRPRRVTDVHFDELVLFDDRPHNAHKKARAAAFRRLMFGTQDLSPHPGVYIRRGQTGDQRSLLNEAALAQHLQRHWGFLVLDPPSASVDDIVQACSGARVVAGVEGSHLVHGLVTMPDDACLFVVQPPDRTECVLKLNTDREGQDFAFVVAQGELSGFSVDLDEVDKTLEMVFSR